MKLQQLYRDKKEGRTVMEVSVHDEPTLEFGYSYDAPILERATDHVLEGPSRMSQQLKWLLFQVAFMTGLAGYVIGKSILALFVK